MAKFKELWEELRMVFSGKGASIVDSIVPLLIFLILSRFFDWQAVLIVTFGINILLTVLRVVKGQKVTYALAGMAGVALAAIFVVLSGTASGYFIPGLISGALTIGICIFSALFRRPLAAFSSFITRRWPLTWYWHPRVRPAYTEVTLFWGLAFFAKLVIQYILYRQDAVNSLGIVSILLGWPYTILILMLSYLYGLWRLHTLHGPSVEEFKAGKDAPWEGQRRGF